MYINNLPKLFLEMLQYPSSPRVYRGLRDFYHKIGKVRESEAFAHLLEARYGDDDPAADGK